MSEGLNGLGQEELQEKLLVAATEANHGKGKLVLGCTLQACKPGTCPASRPKTELSVGNRHMNGLIDEGSYMSEARSWSNTPPYAADRGQDVAAVFAPRGRGRLPVTEGIDIRLAHGLPGKPAEDVPHCPFGKLS